MKRSTFQAALYVALVFVSGVAVGGFGHWMYASRIVNATSGRPSPEEFRRRYVAELGGRLKLNEEQVTQLQSILEQTRVLYKQVYDKHRPEYTAIHEAQINQIRQLLSPWQLAEYEQYRIERDAKMKKKDKTPNF
ncbi:MAG: hypothetical protein IT164_11180 [Bryobacterales bacterium]|nr:hypothetical protein [Bryobacterales bacterium]